MKRGIFGYTCAILSIPLLIKLYHEHAGTWTLVLACLIAVGLAYQILRKLKISKKYFGRMD